MGERLDRSPWLVPLLAAVVALLLRVLHVLDLQGTALFARPIMDAFVHDGWARGSVGQFHEGIAYFRAPLYPWFLQLCYLVDDGYLWPRLVQAVLSAATVGLVADAGRRLYGGAAGLVGGLVLAASWPHIWFTGELLIAVFFCTILMAALWLLVRAGLEDSPRLAVAGALVLGLSSIARPTALVMLPALLWLSLWWWPRAGHPRIAAVRGRLAAGMLVLALLPGLAVTVRNVVVGGDAAFIASQGGVNFYIGNNPQSDGRTAVVPGTRATWLGGYEDTIAMAERAEGRELAPSEVSRWFYGQGLRWWVEEPGDALALLGRKARMLLGAAERSNNMNLHYWRAQAGFLSAPVWLSWAHVLALGVAGLWLARRRRDAAPLWSFLLLYSLVLLAFFVNERFRQPMMVALAVPAGVAPVAMARALAQRQWLPAAGAALLVLAVFGLSSLDRIGFTEDDLFADPFSRYTHANALLEAGEDKAAARLYQEALDIARRYRVANFEQVEPMLRRNFVRALLDARYFEAARVQLERLDALIPNDALTNILWGDYFRAMHEFGPARARYDLVLGAFPDAPGALVGKGWCLVQAESWVAAERHFTQARRLQPGDPGAIAGLGACELEGRGNLARARELLEAALEIDPEHPQAHRFLAAYYQRVNNVDMLARHLVFARIYDPNNITVLRYLTRMRIPDPLEQ